MENKQIVSVIVPLYNAANTIAIALESIIKQTYTGIELILVNDSSSDGSLAVVEGYRSIVESKGFVFKIVNHKSNQGVAAARNTGLQYATGEFIYFLDADDWISCEAITEMVEIAIDTESDIVGCNWYLSFRQNERLMNQPYFSSPWEAIEKMMRGTMRWNLWLFMVKRDLYEDHQIRFIPGNDMGEDMLVSIKLFATAIKVHYMNRGFYHYSQTNNNSLTKTYSRHHMREVSANVAELTRFLEKSVFADRLGDLIKYLKLNIKLPLLITADSAQYELWYNWFPESNNCIMANKSLPLRTRLLQYAVLRRQFWFAKLYYRIVIQFVYGVLYN